MILHDDCLAAMAAMEAESVSAVVTDPPYNLTAPLNWGTLGDAPERTGLRPSGRTSSQRQTGGFMGKAWDGTGIAFDPATWAAALRVAKPSAYLLAFGGTRTVHRMTCAIEDAGWIIRDMLVWAYASGFPKSKASLKPAWEPIVMARKPGPLAMLNIDATRLPIEDDGDGNLRRAGKEYRAEAGGTVYGNGRGFTADMPTTRFYDSKGRWPANLLLTDPIFDGGWEGVVGGGESHDQTATYVTVRDGLLARAAEAAQEAIG